jgi:hypothetical protein
VPYPSSTQHRPIIPSHHLNADKPELLGDNFDIQLPISQIPRFPFCPALLYQTIHLQNNPLSSTSKEYFQQIK